MDFSIIRDMDLNTYSLEQLNSFKNELDKKASDLDKEIYNLKKQLLDYQNDRLELNDYIEMIIVAIKK